MEIVLPRPKAVAWCLAAIAAILAVLHVALQHVLHVRGVAAVSRLAYLFSLDAEANIPSWFASTLLLLAAVLLWAIGAATGLVDRGEARAWYGLALIFAGLSLDEAAALHERSVAPLRSLLGAGGLLYYTWVVPGALFAAVVGAVYVRFLARLPARTRDRFVLAAALFLSGALGLEMIGGREFEAEGPGAMSYVLLVVLEEGLEMLGLIVFLHAPLDHAHARGWEVARASAADLPAAPARATSSLSTTAASPGRARRCTPSQGSG